MIETKLTTLQYWESQKLRRVGHARHDVVTRNKLDSWFINKGFHPVYRAYGEHFAEYYNANNGQVIFVDEIDFFDDSLICSEGWALMWDKDETQYFFAPYNAVRDFGHQWGYRELTYTDLDNSTEDDLQKTLQQLKNNGIAYEL